MFSNEPIFNVVQGKQSMASFTLQLSRHKDMIGHSMLKHLTSMFRGVARIFQRGGHTLSNIIVMVFLPRNIVCCLLKKGLQRGGHGHPRTPLATPLMFYAMHQCEQHNKQGTERQKYNDAVKSLSYFHLATCLCCYICGN